MKTIIASDSFKGSASSKQIGEYARAAILELDETADVEVFPIADGGEGTLEAVVSVLDGEYVTLNVKNPLGAEIKARYGLVNNQTTAVIEMAEASGIMLIEKDQRDIMKASTFGTGQLIKDATSKGVTQILIGIGGSATNDGGMGMAQALGYKFYDENDEILEGNGKNLAHVNRIDSKDVVDELKNISIKILSDVTNPLCGPEGAAAIYGPQKGADEAEIKQLDAGLLHFAQFIEKDLAIKMKDIPGAGAAGGLGGGLIAFANAEIKNGITEILNIIKLEEYIHNADLIITGEGSMDAQSVNGKAPIGVANIAQKYNIPVVAIVGAAPIDLDQIYDEGITAVFSIVNKPITLKESSENVEELVKSAVQNVYRLFTINN